MPKDKDGNVIQKVEQDVTLRVHMRDLHGVLCLVVNQPGAVQDRLDLGWTIDPEWYAAQYAPAPEAPEPAPAELELQPEAPPDAAPEPSEPADDSDVLDDVVIADPA